MAWHPNIPYPPPPARETHAGQYLPVASQECCGMCPGDRTPPPPPPPPLARETHAGQYLPVAPLECCGMCLGDKIHDASECLDLDRCRCV